MINLRLIIVDDDFQTVEVIRDSIVWDMFGIHDVGIAYNVAGAIRLFQEKVPDIVLCDIEMPKGSGIDLLKWARSNNYKSEFIFLTCHESFEYASEALNYNAIGYITKPFNIDKTEIAVTKAVEKIRKDMHLNEYSQYGQYWLENKKLLIEGFWRDLLFYNIPSNASVLLDEILRRKLPVNINDTFSLVLVSVNESINEEVSFEDESLVFELRKLASEAILGEMNFDYTINYTSGANNYDVVIVAGDQSQDQVMGQCKALIEHCREKLNCIVTCYVSDKCSISSLAKAREEMEEMDLNNIIFKGEVFLKGDEFNFGSNEHYTIDINLIGKLFEKGEKIQIVNVLKKEIELLASNNNLNAAFMYSMNQDFMQVVYVFLYKKEIQAHKLFSDKTSQKLNVNSCKSVFDMMKWINYVATITIDYAKEVEKAKTIIDKAKIYIHEHYRENITRNDVSASVFLTSDYLAKLFKSEIGISIKEYIINYRIEKAKEFLINGSESISMIAAEVGFDNFSYFSTLFKKSTGINPYSYRKEIKK